MARKLTEKQRRFVEAFLGPAQGNGTRAAQLAGVDRRSAATMAWKWLRKVEVQKALVARQERKEAVGAVTAAEREQIMGEVARDKTLDLTHRLKAVDMLNRCAGAYSMTHILKGRIGIAQVIARSRRTQQAAK
jgi:phage terminase small subunit